MIITLSQFIELKNAVNNTPAFDTSLIDKLIQDAARIQQEGQTKIVISRQLFEQIQAALANYQIQRQQVDGMTVDRMQSFEARSRYRSMIELSKKDEDKKRIATNSVVGGVIGAAAGDKLGRRSIEKANTPDKEVISKAKEGIKAAEKQHRDDLYNSHHLQDGMGHKKDYLRRGLEIERKEAIAPHQKKIDEAKARIAARGKTKYVKRGAAIGAVAAGVAALKKKKDESMNYYYNTEALTRYRAIRDNTFEFESKKKSKDDEDDNKGKFGKGFRTGVAGALAGASTGSKVAEKVIDKAATTNKGFLYRKSQKAYTTKKGKEKPAQKGMGYSTKSDHQAIRRAGRAVNDLEKESKSPVNPKTGKPFGKNSQAYKKHQEGQEARRKEISNNKAKMKRAGGRIDATNSRIRKHGVGAGAILGVAGAGVYSHIARKSDEKKKQERRFARGMNKNPGTKFDGQFSEFNFAATENPRAKQISVPSPDEFRRNLVKKNKKARQAAILARRARTQQSVTPGFGTSAVSVTSPGY